jgi:hypothetical protein
MNKLKIYCTTIKYLRIMDKFPSYIKPLGLGTEIYPNFWLTDKSEKNLSHLNKYIGELSGIFWIWKNKIHNMNKNDMIGNCHYRKIWLNKLHTKKQKFSYQSLYNSLLSEKNKDLSDTDVFQIQPIKFKNKTLLEDFEDVHESDMLFKSISFLPLDLQNKFRSHLKGNIFFPLNMFISRTHLFEKYCEILFPWLNKCLEYCLEHNLCKDYNMRLPAFLAERFTSFWFSQFKNRKTLSYARLGNFYLSNSINTFINPLKIPFTFRMYPTIHKY